MVYISRHATLHDVCRSEDTGVMPAALMLLVLNHPEDQAVLGSALVADSMHVISSSRLDRDVQLQPADLSAAWVSRYLRACASQHECSDNDHLSYGRSAEPDLSADAADLAAIQLGNFAGDQDGEAVYELNRQFAGGSFGEVWRAVRHQNSATGQLHLPHVMCRIDWSEPLIAAVNTAHLSHTITDSQMHIVVAL